MDKDLLEKAKGAKSVEELLKLAEENNIELHREEAEKIFTRLNSNGELRDDDLDAVSGGGCSEYYFSGPKYAIGHYVSLDEPCYGCLCNVWIVKGINFDPWDNGRREYKVICANCGNEKETYEKYIEGYCDNI